MARYVLSHRRAGKFSAPEKRASREAADFTFDTLFAAGADVVGRVSPRDELAREVIVFEANPAEVAAKAAMIGPDVLVEAEILHFPTAMVVPLDLARAGLANDAALAGTGSRVAVTVKGAGRPVAGAGVKLFLRGPQNRQNMVSATTAKTGKATLRFGPPWTPAALLVLPAGDFWSMIVRGPASRVDVELVPLPATGRSAWWHEALGEAVRGDDLGAGVTVGVIDTGAGPHPHLAHVTSAGAFLDGTHNPTPLAGADVDSHGSHVSGTIGGRPPARSGHPAGIAPGASLLVARVFPGPEDGASQADIANALDHLSRERRADLVNLSLGAPESSQIEHDAIIDATERGTLCICAAANSAGPVEFPAAFPESVAVSAVGLEGWGAPGSLSSIRLPTQPDRFGSRNLYLANFSCFGPEVDCAAPGVGIIATVPTRHGLTEPYAAMDGTSMASPAACGTLAAILSRSAEYLGLARNVTRAEFARDLLRRACVDIGLAAQFEGHGVPSVGL